MHDLRLAVLGLCNPPEPIYLHVKNGELNGEFYLWYNYDINSVQTKLQTSKNSHIVSGEPILF